MEDSEGKEKRKEVIVGHRTWYGQWPMAVLFFSVLRMR